MHIMPTLGLFLGTGIGWFELLIMAGLMLGFLAIVFLVVFLGIHLSAKKSNHAG